MRPALFQVQGDWFSKMSASTPHCDTFRPLLSAYADGEATAAEAALIAAHLALCGACASHLAFVRATDFVLKQTPEVHAPSDLYARIAAATYARPTWQERLTAFLQPVPVRIGVGASLATAAVVAVVTAPRPAVQVAANTAPSAPAPTIAQTHPAPTTVATPVPAPAVAPVIVPETAPVAPPVVATQPTPRAFVSKPNVAPAVSVTAPQVASATAPHRPVTRKRAEVFVSAPTPKVRPAPVVVATNVKPAPKTLTMPKTLRLVATTTLASRHLVTPRLPMPIVPDEGRIAKTPAFEAGAVTLENRTATHDKIVAALPKPSELSIGTNSPDRSALTPRRGFALQVDKTRPQPQVFQSEVKVARQAIAQSGNLAIVNGPVD